MGKCSPSPFCTFDAVKLVQAGAALAGRTHWGARSHDRAVRASRCIKAGRRASCSDHMDPFSADPITIHQLPPLCPPPPPVAFPPGCRSPITSQAHRWESNVLSMSDSAAAWPDARLQRDPTSIVRAADSRQREAERAALIPVMHAPGEDGGRRGRAAR